MERPRLQNVICCTLSMFKVNINQNNERRGKKEFKITTKLTSCDSFQNSNWYILTMTYVGVLILCIHARVHTCTLIIVEK